MPFRRLSAVLVPLVAVFALLLAGSSVTAQAAPPSAPAVAALRIGGSDMANGGDLSRYQYVIMQASEWARVPALKAANPSVKLIAYEDMSLSTDWNCHGGVDDPFPASGLGYCATSAAHPEWFLLDTTGSRVESDWYPGDWFMDIGNVDYQNAWAATVIATLRTKGFDGVMLDDANSDPSGHLGNRTLAKYPTVQSYRDATTSFLQNVCGKVRTAGFLALPNVDGGAPRAVRNQWARACDGTVKEYWVKWGTSTNLQKSGAEWADELAQLDDAEAAGKIMLPIAYSSMSDARSMTYARASFLLGWKGSGSSALIWNTSGVDSWNSSWTASVGTPTGARYSVAGGAWRRDFTAGTVVVNPSASATATVSLGGTYTDASGASVSSVTLAPASGAILAGAPVAAPAPAPAPVGTTTTTTTPTASTTPVSPPASGGGGSGGSPAPVPAPAQPSAPTAGSLGTTSTGSTLTVAQSPDTKYVNRVSVAASSTTSLVRAYLRGVGGSGTQTVRGVVYADAAGAPGALVAKTSDASVPASFAGGWLELSLGSTVRLPAGDYWLGVQFGGREKLLQVGMSQAARGVGHYNSDGFGDGPSAAFGGATASTEVWSVYAPLSAAPLPVLSTATTLGKTAKGGVLTNGQPADSKMVNRVVLDGLADLTKIRTYVAGAGGANTEAVRGVVYSDANGSPSQLRGSTSTIWVAGTAKAGWVDIPFATPLRLQAGAYWVGLQFGGYTKLVRVGYDTAAAGSARFSTDSWNDGPSSAYGSTTSWGEAWAVHAVVSTAALRTLSRGGKVGVKAKSKLVRKPSAKQTKRVAKLKRR